MKSPEESNKFLGQQWLVVPPHIQFPNGIGEKVIVRDEGGRRLILCNAFQCGGLGSPQYVVHWPANASDLASQ